ncbi:CotO family spore coat protein [Bacillus niameyensis]|uniref:CotO family spore coat protein n=1 Tax=Bacillus niameyensis TaxID=1522308 RepID=UPI0007860440|nr:CotO family spore coat protein [Bacillus niameyensis]
MEENEKQRKGNPPLLYIHQPEFTNPETSMQESYSLVDDDEKSEQNLQHHEQEKGRIPQLNPSIEKELNESEKNANDGKDAAVGTPQQVSAADYFRKGSKAKKSWNLTPVKSFKDMSIPEKLQYLAQLPSSQPPFPCEFITQNQRVKGVLDKCIEGEEKFTVMNFKGEIKEIVKGDLKSIRIIF